MGTKNNPGSFDCYANAAPDEPMFILLGRDPRAIFLVKLWAHMSEMIGEDDNKVDNAFSIATDMEQWALTLGKNDKISTIAKVFRIKCLEAANQLAP